MVDQMVGRWELWMVLQWVVQLVAVKVAPLDETMDNDLVDH